jgi:aspartate racemase
MKIIGLIGGMSWESSLEYYRIINEGVKEKLGGLHSAKSLMYSVDFEEIERLQRLGNWPAATQIMIDAAQRLERGGADFVVICTNTMHKMTAEVRQNINIPLLHIADATAQKIKEAGYKKIGLLGTKFTMEEDFYKGRLAQNYGLEVIVPDDAERQIVHDVIYKELCRGIVRPESILGNLSKNGAEAVILGCTEITLLVKQEDVVVPLFDTTIIHAQAAVDYSLSDLHSEFGTL